MEKLIELEASPVRDVIRLLIKDKTTKKNIIFATASYTIDDKQVDEKEQITEDILQIIGKDIQPRVTKSMEEQSQRTRKKAEVFTPSWICNKMNNHCDSEWFGRENVFNTENEKTWEPTTGKIEFPKGKTWQKYVDSKRLEITCGEAPYVVSRYDTTTGEIIPIERRIGILDRKMRIVNENACDEKEWLKWTLRAFQSVYGYEFQGDNLLIARINLLNSYVDYVRNKWNRDPSAKEVRDVANVIVWNFWQMDGITGTIPFGKPKEENHQMTFFDYMQGINDTEQEEIYCRIYDWRRDNSLTYVSIKEGK